MKQLIPFIKKEFLHVLRDRRVLLILFGLPIVQVLLFGFALSNEIKNSGIVVYDQDKSAESVELIQKIGENKYFDVMTVLQSPREFEESFKDGKIRMIVNIPDDFSENLKNAEKPQIQLIADGTDLNLANQINGFITQIIQDFYRSKNPQMSTNMLMVTPEIRMLYNPQLRGAHNFVPGVMAMVLLIVCVMMTAIAIVKEKETGTMEVLLVSPMKPVFIIISKAIPYIILSLLIVGIILVLSVTLLELPIRGSLSLLMLVSLIYILTSLSLGILISVLSDTQQQAMIISLMGMLAPTILLSGFMFPIENMPVMLQYISQLVPATWYFKLISNIMIKGTGFTIIWQELLILLGMAVLLFTLSMFKFKTRLE